MTVNEGMDLVESRLSPDEETPTWAMYKSLANDMTSWEVDRVLSMLVRSGRVSVRDAGVRIGSVYKVCKQPVNG